MTKLITRLVLKMLAIPIAIAAGWLSSAVAKYGLHLTKGDITAAFIVGITAAVPVAIHWLEEVDRWFEHTPVGRDIFSEIAKLRALLEGLHLDPSILGSIEMIVQQELKKLEQRLPQMVQRAPGFDAEAFKHDVAATVAAQMAQEALAAPPTVAPPGTDPPTAPGAAQGG